MVDLQTPPPSYEDVTGMPGAQHNQTNQFFRGEIPSAPPATTLSVVNETRRAPSPYFDNEPITAPILTPSPQSIPSSVQRTTYRPTVYPVSRRTNNAMYREHQSNNDRNVTICYIVVFLAIACFVSIISAIVKSGSIKTKYNTPDLNAYDNYEYMKPKYHVDYEKWQRDNEELLNSLPNRYRT